ncbi:MAG: DUF438 domain-containing protein [Lachnospiraceae bacterium]|nr:DUF438 domain-containing protein [Lachnospiraceae bacterium]
MNGNTENNTNVRNYTETNIKNIIENNTENRTELLKNYLKRLGEGESLESVRSDFVEKFSEVDASEIMKAEQELLNEGTPITEVQKLCDIHAALFHGATIEEKIANAEKAVSGNVDYSDKHTKALRLEKIIGHPLYTFTKENEALTELLNKYNETKDMNVLAVIRDVSIHYAKKGDLIYPQLNVRHGISGPSDVMWTVDDEIRDEFARLMKEDNHNEKWNQRLEAVLKRIEDMIYKEQKILFPNCAVNFTEDEWIGIYHDSKDYAVCFDVENEIWDKAENKSTRSTNKSEYSKEEIVMPGGHMTIEQLTALLNTIPLEISFIDDNNINRFFNEGPKVFKRPGMAIDREVFSCHPPKIEPMVRAIIEDFRNNKRDSVQVWTEKGGRSMLVTYMAVRDKEENYIGTVELVQDMEFAKEHFKK